MADVLAKYEQRRAQALNATARHSPDVGEARMAIDGASIVVTLDIGGSAAKAVAYDAASQRSLASTAGALPRPAQR